MNYGFNDNKSRVDMTTGVDQADLSSFVRYDKGTKNITASSFKVSSARKFKENIHPTVFNGLATINKVEVVDYNYIDDTSKAPKVGLIADDCPAILAAPDRMSLDMNNCIGVLMKAVQELSNKVEILEKRVKELESL